jgi:hypothetical protein
MGTDRNRPRSFSSILDQGQGSSVFERVASGAETMSFMDFLSSGLRPRRERRGDVETIAKPPSGVVLHELRPRPDAAPVRAWRAERTGHLQTGGGELRYRAGRDFIVEHGPRDFSVVRADIFEKTYERIDVDRYVRRADVTLHYFTLDRAVHVKTLEGIQAAEAGDWTLVGVKGELWPVKAHHGAAKFERIN